jgi:16S rRNA (adenine1518-N6/adenine1519-N6)-dimethyltransferase
VKPRLDKSLGQHFLTRPEVCAPLIAFLAPAGHKVVEIGPGSGVLTGLLLENDAEVFAFEVDPRWGLSVGRGLDDLRLRLAVADALELSWERLPRPCLLTGNLPYNVGTALILAALESTLEAPGIERAGFLVQKEVAERLVARPGSPAYGSLSVIVRLLARAEMLGRVAPGAFNPPPRVESAFVGLTPSPPGLTREAYARLKRLVRSAFALRRKTLRNSLASEWGVELARALVERSGLPLNTRAESLGLETFRELDRILGELQTQG